MKPEMFCRNSSGMPAPVAQLDEVGGLERGLAEQDPVVGDDADRVAVERARSAHTTRRAVVLLELVQLASRRRCARDQLARVVGRARVERDDVEQPVGVLRRRARLARAPTAGGRGRGSVATIERTISSAWSSSSARWSTTPERARVHLAAAELLGGDLLARRRLHQRRAAEEDRALLAHDHRLVAHRRARRRRRRCTSPSRARSAGCPRADIVAWLKKIRPKCSRSGKTSSCMGRNAPPESTR